MYSVRRMGATALLAAFSLFAAGCGQMTGNLLPSGQDKRPAATATGTGYAVGQTAPEFTMPDTKGGTLALSVLLAQGKPVVMYFNMWCPICDAHLQELQSGAMTTYPNVTYIAVDYVSGSVAAAASAQEGAGYGNAPFSVGVDIGQTVLNGYHATMGTTIVIDTAGVIRMNEDMKDGAALLAALGAL